MKIALLSVGMFPYDIGGIQKHSYYLAKYFAKNEINVDVYCSGVESEKVVDLKDHFEPAELEYIRCVEVDFPTPPPLPGHYVYASYLFSKKIYEKLSEVQRIYDAIYAQGFTSWFFIKNEILQKKLITNLHGLEMFQTSINPKHRLGQWLLQIPAKSIIRHSLKQVSLGGKLTDILYSEGARKDSVVELPNGIHYSWIREEKNVVGLNQRKPHFIFIGRYERRKGIEEFQEVIQKTIGQWNYQVTFVGPIPEEKQVKHANVHYVGLIKDSEVIKRSLLNADILVCPSYSEGMPTVILEAMASGCAIIATDVGATSTMVSKDNGWLITGDIITGLEEAMEQAVQASKNELKFKKRQSIEKVTEHFTWDKVIQKTIIEVKSF